MIRLYQEKDVEPVYQVWIDASEFAMPGLAARSGFTLENLYGYFKNTIVVENQIWVYEKENKPVGYLAIAKDFIDRLYVKPAFHRQGIGQALLNQARILSPNHLWLFTHQTNQACAFYEKNNFVATKFGVSPPPENEPDVEYHWYLK
jgi:ribosomal protein S18 acetylase RimI-like enzyme